MSSAREQRTLWGTLGPFWRVGVVAVLAAGLTFGASFLIAPTYESSTQLLIRGRDASFLTTTGEGLRDQPGVVDASLAEALGQTQRALLSSRAVARMVVDDLGPDVLEAPPQTGFAAVRGQIRDLVSRTRTFLTHGFVDEPDPVEELVDEIHDGLTAEVMQESYMLELTAEADAPRRAALIADSAADALVEISRERFQRESENHRDFLADQLEVARGEEREAAAAVEAFKRENDVSELGLDIELGATSTEELRRQQRDNRIELAGAEAELSSIQDALTEVQETRSTTSEIVTGRSTTTIEASNASTLHDELTARKATAESQVAALEAREERIQEALDPGNERRLTEEESRMRELELSYAVASDTVSQLSERHQEAILTAGSGRLEVTRVDTANVPLFPSAPTRYVYLALGAVLGALAGLLLTGYAAWRRGETLFGPQAAAIDGDDVPSDTPAEEVIDLTGEDREPSQERVTVGRYEIFAPDTTTGKESP